MLLVIVPSYTSYFQQCLARVRISRRIKWLLSVEMQPAPNATSPEIQPAPKCNQPENAISVTMQPKCNRLN